MTLFKDIKEGYPVFIFDRAGITASQGKVVSKSPSHFDSHYGSPTEMVVDVSLEYDGNIKTFTFKEATEIGYIDSLSICTERDVLLREIEAKRAQEDAIRLQTEQAISQLEIHKENVDKCAKLLSDFNPALREKKETEERLSKMETSMVELKDMLKGLVSELKG